MNPFSISHQAFLEMGTEPGLRAVLEPADADELYWSRNEASQVFSENVQLIERLMSQGCLLAAPSGCCRTDYLLTRSGSEVLLRFRQGGVRNG